MRSAYNEADYRYHQYPTVWLCEPLPIRRKYYGLVRCHWFCRAIRHVAEFPETLPDRVGKSQPTSEMTFAMISQAESKLRGCRQIHVENCCEYGNCAGNIPRDRKLDCSYEDCEPWGFERTTNSTHPIE